ncbi:MAG: NUDIX hydrolase [Chloroflexi bacterium]|nr:NUDIX hydrolase [Chloroflexota bacterium]
MSHGQREPRPQPHGLSDLRTRPDPTWETSSFDPSAGRGVPAWLAASLHFCSRCGAPLRLGTPPDEDRERLACEACGYVAYVNPRLVVTTLPVTDAGEVMLLRRGIEPGRGMWAQPGGFLEIDETVREGAIRETAEETGLVVEPGEIVGLYTRPEAAIVVVAFVARIVGGAPTATPEALEVRPFAPAAIPWAEIAFRTTEWALRDWVLRVRPDLGPAGR